MSDKVIPNDEFDFWVCDECHHIFSLDIEQVPVRIQQRTERLYGTDILSRPVERLIVCPGDYHRFGGK
jgi:hypothetical protein